MARALAISSHRQTAVNRQLDTYPVTCFVLFRQITDLIDVIFPQLANGLLNAVSAVVRD